MGILTTAGVIDTGVALVTTAGCARESSVKFLLQQQDWRASGQEAARPDYRDRCGATPLIASICRLAAHALPGSQTQDHEVAH